MKGYASPPTPSSLSYNSSPSALGSNRRPVPSPSPQHLRQNGGSLPLAMTKAKVQSRSSSFALPSAPVAGSRPQSAAAHQNRYMTSSPFTQQQRHNSGIDLSTSGKPTRVGREVVIEQLRAMHDDWVQVTERRHLEIMTVLRQLSNHMSEVGLSTQTTSLVESASEALVMCQQPDQVNSSNLLADAIADEGDEEEEEDDEGELDEVPVDRSVGMVKNEPDEQRSEQPEEEDIDDDAELASSISELNE